MNRILLFVILVFTICEATAQQWDLYTLYNVKSTGVTQQLSGYQVPDGWFFGA